MAMNRTNRRPDRRDDWYSSSAVHDAKFGLLSTWHPQWVRLTPAEWLDSPGTGVQSEQTDMASAASETEPRTQ